MPTFDNISVELSTTIDVDFEVFCGTCGKGLCSESDTRRSIGRNYLQVTVNACPACIEDKDKEIQALSEEVSRLESKVYELEQKLE